MSASREEVMPPELEGPRPPTCAMCDEPVAGKLVRVLFDGWLVCAGCDPSVPEE